MKIFNIVIILMTMMLITGCQNNISSNGEEDLALQEEIVYSNNEEDVDYDIIDEAIQFNVDNINIASWLVYWDMEDGINEVYNSPELDTVNVFSVNFNEDYSFNINGNIKNIINNIKDTGKEVYVTVVNDVFKNDGSAIQKDSNFIRELLLNESIKKRNIDNLVNLAVEFGVVGIDLDYENIDDDLWEEYLVFIDELGKRLKEVNKKLRIVLEMDAPIDKLNFPEEYEYIIMAYDLHGFGTEAGPKIDKESINSISKNLNENIDNPRISFSLGGFSFSDNGRIVALNKSSIDEIITNNNIIPKRDDSSYTLTFNYIDEENNNNEIWYSDEETIKKWIEIAFKNGISNFDFWYLDKMAY